MACQELKEAIKKGDLEKPGVIFIALLFRFAWGICDASRLQVIKKPAGTIGSKVKIIELRTVIDALDAGANLQHCYANGITPFLGTLVCHSHLCILRLPSF